MAGAKFFNITLLSFVSEKNSIRINFVIEFRHSVEQLNVICWRERFRDGHRYVNHSLYLHLKPESLSNIGG